MSPPTPPAPRLGRFTRLVVIPLIILCVGIRLGMVWEHPTQAVAVPAPAEAPPATAPAALPVESASRPTLEVSGSFQNNLYPSLIVSFGARYPVYTRCLAVTVSGGQGLRDPQLRVESELFEQAAVSRPASLGPNFSASPDLPWNFDLLRRIDEDKPVTFVVTLLDGDRAVGQASVVCLVHAVNQVVTRVVDSSSGQWRDTSLCVAAFVNEGSTAINALLQDAIARGSVSAFTGYEFGPSAVNAQLRAIWETLAARGLSYVNVATMTTPTPGITTQSVRSVEQSLHDHGANCVDGSVLFASILRKIGLRPLLVFKPGHCLVAFYDQADGGKLVGLETTLLNSDSFAAALAAGSNELRDALPYFGQPDYSCVDVAAARQEGIVPIAAP